MTTIELTQTSLDSCVRHARRERVLITSEGKPIALVVNVEGLDEEQIELGGNDKFWRMIAKRRKQSTVNRAQLERLIARKSKT